jgi:hypothetical protein
MKPLGICPFSAEQLLLHCFEKADQTGVSEKHQRDEIKLHRHIMREKFFSKIVSMQSSSQSSANYLRETRQFT